jgi:hypothetical protein
VEPRGGLDRGALPRVVDAVEDRNELDMAIALSGRPTVDSVGCDVLFPGPDLDTAGASQWQHVGDSG